MKTARDQLMTACGGGNKWIWDKFQESNDMWGRDKWENYNSYWATEDGVCNEGMLN